ncbi:uncharacterized protein LOC122301658 [Carya illinoinensis]|uniref:uncharacterized protein LOC122301658 n=1 Tax=Carya illinoinensis TaxID=32201 RepID=UPI001C719405|nr:uncharacterized protein LOC122301658 [Carya illinoinensis]
MANSIWNTMFSNAIFNALPAIKSNHSPLHLKLSIPILNTQRSQDKFRFEASWQLHEDCSTTVESTLENSREGLDAAPSFRNRLAMCASSLKRWISGRMITDNMIVAYETLHSMNTRMFGKFGFMALKLDMSKTYDREERGLLKAVMERLGFTDQWISLIMNCITLVSFSLLLNGGVCSSFKPTRSIRQGDPLSSYLFITYVEALSNMLFQAESHGIILNVPIGGGHVYVNHLFFADTSFLFCKANSLEWSKILFILKVYEKAYGQMLNKEKIAIHFSRNTPMEVMDNILSISSIKSKGSFERYLGLLAVIGRSKASTFHSLLDRIWSRVKKWKTNSLSATGKEILLKSVLQAIPFYAMGIFLLPNSITCRINKLLKKFWWEFNEDTSKI